MVLSGWRLAVAALIGAVLLVLLVAVALWVAIGLAVLGAVVWLNLVVLPRLARRLHVPRVALDVTCLLLFGGVGWLLNGSVGLALGGLAWMAGVVGPRIVARRLAARVRKASGSPRVIVIDSPALPNSPQPGSSSARY